MPALQCVAYSVVIVLIAAVGAGAFAARAQYSYLAKPLRSVTAGASIQTAMLVRFTGHKLSERWSQLVVIENRTDDGRSISHWP